MNIRYYALLVVVTLPVSASDNKTVVPSSPKKSSLIASQGAQQLLATMIASSTPPASVSIPQGSPSYLIANSCSPADTFASRIEELDAQLARLGHQLTQAQAELTAEKNAAENKMLTQRIETMADEIAQAKQTKDHLTKFYGTYHD